MAQAVEPAEPRFISAFLLFSRFFSIRSYESVMDQLRRRVPHVWAEGKRLFVTWHLYGSLPNALYAPPNKQNAGQAVVWMDRYLDSARVGPLYLKQQPIAQLVVDSIHFGAQSSAAGA